MDLLRRGSSGAYQPVSSPSPLSASRLPNAVRVAALLFALLCLVFITREFHVGPTTSHLASLAGLELAEEVHCVVVQQGGVNSGGYGDHLRLTHRAELMAQVLGCEYMRSFTESGHRYASSNLFSRSPVKISLPSRRTCDIGSVLDIPSLEADNHDCTPTIIGDTSQCDIYTYTPRTLLYNSNKLACVAERLRPKMSVTPSTRPSNIGNHCTNGYAALHYRYGDLANHIGDFRTTGVAELNDAIDMVHNHYGFSDDCTIIFAENYPHPRIENVEGGHVVDNTTDSLVAMADMAGATVLFGAASGFMLPITLLFTGREILVPPGVANRFAGLPREGVQITETRVEMERVWPVHPEDNQGQRK